MRRLFLVLAVATFTTPALGFGLSVGTPLEERVGGDYGPEYYRNLQSQRSRSEDGRGSTRCRTRLIETRFGLRRVRRCYLRQRRLTSHHHRRLRRAGPSSGVLTGRPS